MNLFHKLNTEDQLHNTLRAADVLQKHSLQFHESCAEEELIHTFIRKLLMMNYRARYITTKETNIQDDTQQRDNGSTENTSDIYKELSLSNKGKTQSEQIDPMDVQMAAFHCADVFLKQLMVTKLSQCQYALPLLVPDPFTQQIEFPLWTFRQIIKSWKIKNANKEIISQTQPIYKAETPMVFFFRFGSVSSSKSQLMNSLISEKHNTFFHRNCQGSSRTRVLMDGVVEIAWFCPSGTNDDDKFTDCVAFCNLHGDAGHLEKQLQILTDLASVNVVLLTQLDQNDRRIKFENLYKDLKPLICLFTEDESTIIETRKGKYKIGMKNRNQSEVSEELRGAIKGCLSDSSSTFRLKDLAKYSDIRVDEEDDDDCRRGREAAQQMISLLEKKDLTEIKESFMPHQGKLWHQWSQKNRELHRPTADETEINISRKHSELRNIRQQQHESDISEFVKFFIKEISSHAEHKKLFIKWLSILLNEHTSAHLSSLHHKYNEKWSTVLKLKGNYENSEQLSAEQMKLEKISEELEAATFGLEHIMRELGQIYESCPYVKNENKKEENMIKKEENKIKNDDDKDNKNENKSKEKKNVEKNETGNNMNKKENEIKKNENENKEENENKKKENENEEEKEKKRKEENEEENEIKKNGENEEENENKKKENGNEEENEIKKKEENGNEEKNEIQKKEENGNEEEKEKKRKEENENEEENEIKKKGENEEENEMKKNENRNKEENEMKKKGENGNNEEDEIKKKEENEINKKEENENKEKDDEENENKKKENENEEGKEKKRKEENEEENENKKKENGNEEENEIKKKEENENKENENGNEEENEMKKKEENGNKEEDEIKKKEENGNKEEDEIKKKEENGNEEANETKKKEENEIKKKEENENKKKENWNEEENEMKKKEENENKEEDEIKKKEENGNKEEDEIKKKEENENKEKENGNEENGNEEENEMKKKEENGNKEEDEIKKKEENGNKEEDEIKKKEENEFKKKEENENKEEDEIKKKEESGNEEENDIKKKEENKNKEKDDEENEIKKKGENENKEKENGNEEENEMKKKEENENKEKENGNEEENEMKKKEESGNEEENEIKKKEENENKENDDEENEFKKKEENENKEKENGNEEENEMKKKEENGNKEEDEIKKKEENGNKEEDEIKKKEESGNEEENEIKKKEENKNKEKDNEENEIKKKGENENKEEDEIKKKEGNGNKEEDEIKKKEENGNKEEDEIKKKEENENKKKENENKKKENGNEEANEMKKKEENGNKEEDEIKKKEENENKKKENGNEEANETKKKEENENKEEDEIKKKEENGNKEEDEIKKKEENEIKKKEENENKEKENGNEEENEMKKKEENGNKEEDEIKKKEENGNKEEDEIKKKEENENKEKEKGNEEENEMKKKEENENKKKEENENKDENEMKKKEENENKENDDEENEIKKIEENENKENDDEENEIKKKEENENNEEKEKKRKEENENEEQNEIKKKGENEEENEMKKKENGNEEENENNEKDENEEENEIKKREESENKKREENEGENGNEEENEGENEIKKKEKNEKKKKEDNENEESENENKIHNEINVSSFPSLAAEMMISGFPLELMDGDAVHVPVIWISAVLDELIQKLGDQRVFVLSVLGIQSSGKSTMLNAMFGLQFAVSAGRCTRGAFMQLHRVADEMKEQLNFDYLLVVDTEGLNALELAGRSTRNHDNELATFVVGLANLTLINIFGENPAEMQDILQIVVQALQRMKKVRLNPSCVFVHQNISDITAGQKNMEGRRRLQEKLDELTKIAAKDEVCDAEYFSDVIRFNVHNDVNYIAQLWEGNPPMAPPNPKYCENIQQLKKTIMSHASKSNKIMLVDLKDHIKDLWEALLNERFVFSFQNSLEISAYKKLETEYSKWSWSFRSVMMETENKLQNKIENDAILEIEETDIHRELKKTSEEVKKLILEFFEKDKDKDILIRWKTSFEIKIKELQESTVRDTMSKLNGILQQQGLKKKFDAQRTHHENILLEKTKELALNIKDKANNEETLKREFDLFWKKLTKKIIKDTPAIKDVDIMSDVRKILSGIYGECLYPDLWKEGKKFFSVPSFSEYVTFTRSTESWFKKAAGKVKGIFGYPQTLSPEDEAQIRSLVSNVVQQTDRMIQNFNISKMGYNIGYIQKLTDYIKTSVTEHQEGPVKYMFKNEFFVDLVLSICEKLNKMITDQHRLFREANDPDLYTEKKKEQYYNIFQKYCHGAKSAAILSGIICQKLKESIEQSVSKKTARDLTDEMRSNCESLNGNRSNMEKHILKRLAEEEDFDKYMNYIHNPRDHFKSFIRDEVSRYITDQFSVSVIPKMKENIKVLQKKIMKAAHESTEHVQVNSGDVGLWLKSFTQQLSDELVISEKDLSGVKHDVDDFNLLEAVIRRELSVLMSDISRRFNRKEFPVKLDYKLRSNELLIDHFCQCCWVQCPFCGATCTNTIENHDGDHSVPFHRNIGQNGWIYSKTTNLCINICTSSVASDGYFYLNESDDTVLWKEYRTAGGVFADWSITPDLSELPYWKWFMCRFQEDLEKYYNKTFEGCGKIPDEWRKYTKQEVFKSLDKYI